MPKSRILFGQTSYNCSISLSYSYMILSCKYNTCNWTYLYHHNNHYSIHNLKLKLAMQPNHTITQYSILRGMLLMMLKTGDAIFTWQFPKIASETIIHEQGIAVHNLKHCINVRIDDRVIHLEPRSNPPLRSSLRESQFYVAIKEASVKTDFGWNSNPRLAQLTFLKANALIVDLISVLDGWLYLGPYINTILKMVHWNSLLMNDSLAGDLGKSSLEYCSPLEGTIGPSIIYCRSSA